MVKHVEQLAMRLVPDWWKKIVPWSVQPLRYYREEARAKRGRFIVCQRSASTFNVYVAQGQVNIRKMTRYMARTLQKVRSGR